MIGVYGADGFIGQHVMRRLLEKPAQIRAVSRKFRDETVAEFGHRAELVQADMRQVLDMATTLEGVHTVVQLISTSNPSLGNDHLIVDIQDNVIAHVEFLGACLRAGVKRVVFVSSGGSVYGPGAPIPTPENAETNPISSHGLTKLFVEKYLRMFGHVNDLDFVILRLSNPYGPGQRFRKGQGLIPAILKQYDAGKPIKIFGGGLARRDYVFIDDAAEAIARSVYLKGPQKQILNIGSGASHSVLEVLDLVEKVKGIKLEREFINDRPTDVLESRLDITLAEQALDWKPQVTLEDGLKAYLT